MRRCASVAPLGSTFDKFLFAPLGDDENGMPISVLSALARLGLDPWHEAASLARLSAAGATQRLTTLINSLPDWPPTSLNSRTVAVGLVALLPQAVNSAASMSVPLPGAKPASRIQATVVVSLCVAVWAFMFGSQLIAASRQPSAHARHSSLDSPPIAPPGRDK